jgi:AcrR family transcriptional regulator
MGKTNSALSAKLGREDWVQAAIAILMTQGIQAVKVDRLAKALQITRGSFYWHFQDLDDLLAAMIQSWRSVMTEDVIQAVETNGGSANQKLFHLFELAAADDDRLEKAMRIWAIADDRVAAAIVEVDQQRIAYLQSLFTQIGFAPPDAAIRSQVAYSVRLGWFIMALPSTPATRLKEIQLLYPLLTQAIALNRSGQSH